MKTDLFIPKTIVVGCQKRTDTYLGELGYIIYRDNKGKLRKETSWQNWRDKSIEPREFPNEPTAGFTFNKGVQRYGDWNSTGRSLVRVFDPRGYEFEVSIENLIGILMHSDVSKRDIVQECVYAWYGTELILLPTNSEVYKESRKHTDKQDMKVGTKELGIGYTYELKKERTHVVYLGRVDTYEWKSDHVTEKQVQVYKKQQHAFYRVDTGYVEFKAPTAYLASVVSEECHPQYAEFMDNFYRKYESQPVTRLELQECKIPDTVEVESNPYVNHYGEERKGYYLANTVLNNITGSRYVQLDEHRFLKVNTKVELHDHYNWGPVKVEVEFSHVAVFDPETRTFQKSRARPNSYSSYYMERYPEVKIEGLNEHTPIVQEKMKEIKADLVAAVANFKTRKYDNTPVDDELKHVLQNVLDVARKYKMTSYLVGVMQSGHKAKDTIY